MKRIFSLILIVICFLFTIQAGADTIDITPSLEKPVSSDGSTRKFYITSTDEVPAGGSQCYRIDTGFLYGQVVEFGFISNSDNASTWLSEGEDDNATTLQTFLLKNTTNRGETFAFDPIHFHNMDSPLQKVMYLTVENNDTDNMTGWSSTITIENGR